MERVLRVGDSISLIGGVRQFWMLFSFVIALIRKTMWMRTGDAVHLAAEDGQILQSSR